jgi:hypothetical protein
LKKVWKFEKPPYLYTIKQQQTTPSVMKKFNAPETYIFRFIGDSELRPEVKILKRTEKSVWFKVHGYDQARAKVMHDSEGNEYFYPLGRYSMAPTCNA